MPSDPVSLQLCPGPVQDVRRYVYGIIFYTIVLIHLRLRNMNTEIM